MNAWSDGIMIYNEQESWGWRARQNLYQRKWTTSHNNGDNVIIREKSCLCYWPDPFN